MESAAYLQRYYPLGASFGCSCAGALDALQRASDYHLTGGVVVRDPSAFNLPACFGDTFHLETYHCGHGPRVGLGGRLHCFTSCLDERGPLGRAQRTGSDERGVLAKAVAGNSAESLGSGAAAERPVCCRIERHEAERVSRQLGVARRPERVWAGVEQEFGQVSPDHLAQLVDDLPGRVVAPREPHAGAL